MDPLAKRSMWKALEILRPGRSIFLTVCLSRISMLYDSTDIYQTHSMEEADALASRVGIIAKHLLDIGTAQHLREKHGHGFHIHLVLKGSPLVDDAEMECIKTWMEQHIVGAKIEGKPYHGQMRFNIPSTITASVDDKDEIMVDLARNKKERSIAELFLLLEENKEQLGIEFYSISPSTFDEVFLKVVEKHHVGEEEPPLRPKNWYRWLGGKY
jgi:ATP-binding cassette, subfamily A (ABC1), member 3